MLVIGLILTGLGGCAGFDDAPVAAIVEAESKITNEDIPF